MIKHTYSTHLVWQGSTAGGYLDYPRTHSAIARPAETTIELSADPAFRGNPAQHNPEQLLVMAVSSCQLLSFLAVAAQHGIEVLDYEDSATGYLATGEAPVGINRIDLTPVVRVARGTNHHEVRRLIALAHENCFIANSLTSTITLEVTVIDV